MSLKRIICCGLVLCIVGFHYTNTVIASESFVFGKACLIQPEERDTKRSPECGMEESRPEQQSTHEEIFLKLLGLYDYAAIYGSEDFQVFGKDRDRVRAFLMVQPIFYYEINYTNKRGKDISL